MEEYVPWYCDAIASPVFVQLHEINCGTGVTISLRETALPRRRISLYFADWPTAIRIANESDRLRSLRVLPKGHHHSFYLVRGSKFLEWLNSESLGLSVGAQRFHLAILTDEWIDLICNEQPVVTVEETQTDHE